MTGFPINVVEWSRNERESVRIRIDSYQGRPTIDIRTWYTGPEGNLRPGKGGMTLGVKHLPRLAAGLAKALTEAQRRGLIDEEAAHEEQ